MSKSRIAAAMIAVTWFITGPAIAADGAALYQPCKACHLVSGKGVPGAFPPLGDQIASLASRDDGRAYLSLVIKRGMIGVLKVNGMTYRGAMPARPQYESDDVAALLNYILSDIVGDGASDVAAFTAEEVQASWDAHPKARGKAVLDLRPDLSKSAPTSGVKEGALKTKPEIQDGVKLAEPVASGSKNKPNMANADDKRDPADARWAEHLATLKTQSLQKPSK